MISALLFDFDGLIVDTESCIYQSWQELYESFGAQLEPSTWARQVGIITSEGDHLADLEGLIGGPVDRATLAPKRKQRELELIRAQPARPGVQDYLRDAWRLGIKTGLASSAPCSWVTGHLERLGLIDDFDIIWASDDVRRVKPDPELYLAVLDALGVTAAEALALEDSPAGVHAAQRAGIFCVAVPNPLTRLLPLDHADLRLDSLAEIPLEALIQQVELLKNRGCIGGQ